MAFTENLRRLRVERFFSQAELARRAGLHALTITRLEAGVAAPATRTIRALAEVLDVEARELAMPDEVAELRRTLERAGRTHGRLDHWNDDGGSAQPAPDGERSS